MADSALQDAVVPVGTGTSTLAQKVADVQAAQQAPTPAPDVSAAAQQPDTSNLAQSAAPTDLPRFQRTVGNTVKGILMGFLMDGPKGAIAGGISPTGVQRAADQQQQVAQAKVKFENAQAANMVTEAAIHDQMLHNLPQEQQDAHNTASMELMKGFSAAGMQPVLVVDNNHGGASAMAGLQQLTDSHGAVPPLFTINLGNKVVAYDLNQLMQAPMGLDQINKVRAVQGQPPIDQKVWQQMTATPAGRTQGIQMLHDALGFFNPEPSEKNLAAYQNYVNTLQAQPQSPERDANIAKLQGAVDIMKKTLDATSARANQQLAQKTQAEQLGKESTPGGQLDLKSKKADIALKGAETQKTKVETAQIVQNMSYGDNLIDPFGVKPGVTPSGQVLDKKEFNTRADKFTKDYVQPINKLAKTQAEFDRINNDPSQTGAEKVTALLAAVGISGDALKGQGFRISTDVINEHAEARNVWQSFVQKWNKVAGSGGPITSQQIADYTKIAEGVVHDSYVNAAQEARRQGLPVDFLPKAVSAGQKASDNTIQIYVDAAGGDTASAEKALRAAGWK